MYLFRKCELLRKLFSIWLLYQKINIRRLYFKDHNWRCEWSVFYWCQADPILTRTLWDVFATTAGRLIITPQCHLHAPNQPDVHRVTIRQIGTVIFLHMLNSTTYSKQKSSMTPEKTKNPFFMSPSTMQLALLVAVRTVTDKQLGQSMEVSGQTYKQVRSRMT